MLRLTAVLRAVALIAALPFAMAATAAELPRPTGEVILTVSGAITVHNDGDKAVFDLPMLEAMPKASFTTGTIWTEGKSTFEGVRLKDLLAAVGASGRTLHTIALNDYAVDVPASDAVADGPILAYRIDGKILPVRNRGPLWLIYPYDSKDEYRSEVVYARSIWQLDRIELKD